MNYDNNMLKQAQAQAAKTQYADECAGQVQAGIGQAVAANGASRIPLKEQIERSSFDIHHRSERLNRAHQILTEHPEFEKFLELQDIINRGLFR